MYNNYRRVLLTVHCTRQHWLRWWLVAWRQQTITWTNVDFSLVRFCGISLRTTVQRAPKILFCMRSWKIILLWLLPHLTGTNEFIWVAGFHPSYIIHSTWLTIVHSTNPTIAILLARSQNQQLVAKKMIEYHRLLVNISYKTPPRVFILKHYLHANFIYFESFIRLTTDTATSAC